ncbi:MAG: xylose isomerase [Phycisphaerales bacterium]|nr:xylose isomerase [Phycisphaerales bacterium]
MNQEHFSTVSHVQFIGDTATQRAGARCAELTKSSQPAFHHYDASAHVEGRPMRDHLRFAACYWHTMRNGLADPFGAPTAKTPWDDGSDSIDNATRRADAFFEFLAKCQIDRWCFHDRDLAPEGETIAQSERNLDALVAHAASLQSATGKRLLWGTANLFSHPRYMHGAATSPQTGAFLHACAQVRKAMEVTHALGGEGYVFWGGREGYDTLLNTDLAREREQLARFLHMAVEHARAIGFNGVLLIEPKPHEPTTHQYDSDSEATLNFLREFGLMGSFKLNIETNHATLAGHAMEHELAVAIAANSLGSVDANMGTAGLGWDTDRFPTDAYLTTRIMLAILNAGGFEQVSPHGGLNFDAKRRRESFEPVDLFHAHVAGMDAFAIGLKAAARIRADGRLREFVSARYASWEMTLGKEIRAGQRTLEQCAQEAQRIGETPIASGRQEMLEAIINDILFARDG